MATSSLTSVCALPPGDTDLAWTRCTPWRSMLAAALDQMPAKVESVKVTAEMDNASSTLPCRCGLAGASASRSRCTRNRARHHQRPPGDREGRDQPDPADGLPRGPVMPDQPDRHVALKRRELADLLTEELRRLDIDETYEKCCGTYTEHASRRLKEVLPAPQQAADDHGHRGHERQSRSATTTSRRRRRRRGEGDSKP